MRRIYTTKTATTVDVDFKFDYDRQLGRTWVNKESFYRLNEAYENSQEHQHQPLDVEFEVILTMKHDGKNVTKKPWVHSTTVYGGVNGLRLFMKHKVIDLVYTYEDSDYEIQTMQLSRLYVMKRKQQIATHFKDIKMYNLCFNYCGYGLSVAAGQTPQACVPSYLLAKYNNKDETNPRKKIARLTMNKLLNELSMSSIDEGCSCSQVIHFCNLHKIVYYILDFRYKLFESNNHMKYRTDLPRLVFMCANGHMYPIEDHDKRESIFRTFSFVGGGMKKLKATQVKDGGTINDSQASKTNAETVHVHYSDMAFYGLLEHVQTMSGNRQIVVTEPGLCNTVFYDEIRNGNIHNGKVKMDKNGQVTQFRLNGILIDENPYYNDIAMTICELNSTIKTEVGKYMFGASNTTPSLKNIIEEILMSRFTANVPRSCTRYSPATCA